MIFTPADWGAAIRALIRVIDAAPVRAFPVSESGAPDSLESLRALSSVSSNGTLCIPVLRDHSEGTIWGPPAANHAFRAWHDSHHLVLSTRFDRQGEYATWAHADRALVGAGLDILPRLIIRAEIVGQVDYHETWGSFPEDQVAFCRAAVAAMAEDDVLC